VVGGERPPTTRYAVLPEGPYRDPSSYAEERVRHLDHLYSIAERPPGSRGDALRS